MKIHVFVLQELRENLQIFLFFLFQNFHFFFSSKNNDLLNWYCQFEMFSESSCFLNKDILFQYGMLLKDVCRIQKVYNIMITLYFVHHKKSDKKHQLREILSHDLRVIKRNQFLTNKYFFFLSIDLQSQFLTKNYFLKKIIK